MINARAPPPGRENHCHAPSRLLRMISRRGDFAVESCRQPPACAHAILIRHAIGITATISRRAQFRNYWGIMMGFWAIAMLPMRARARARYRGHLATATTYCATLLMRARRNLYGRRP